MKKCLVATITKYPVTETLANSAGPDQAAFDLVYNAWPDQAAFDLVLHCLLNGNEK